MVIRFVDSESNIREEFLGFIHCVEGTSGAAIADLIFGQIKTFGLDMNNCRGQGHDGAGNMSGKNEGVSSRIAAENKVKYYKTNANFVINFISVFIFLHFSVTNL